MIYCGIINLWNERWELYIFNGKFHMKRYQYRGGVAA